MPNPARMPPTLLRFSFFENIKRNTPITARTGAKEDGFKRFIIKLSPLIPVSERIQAVAVVPTLAPMITPIALESSIMPEFTKPTAITVTAEDD